MQDRVDDPPIVRCPGCDQPMEAKERTPVAERLVDIRYVCAACGMETKRTVAGRALFAQKSNRAKAVYSTFLKRHRGAGRRAALEGQRRAKGT
jgi:hypothetical protein